MPWSPCRPALDTYGYVYGQPFVICATDLKKKKPSPREMRPQKIEATNTKLYEQVPAQMKVANLRKQMPTQMKVAFVALLICKAVCAVGDLAPTRWTLSKVSRQVRSQGPSCVHILSNPSQEPEELGTKVKSQSHVCREISALRLEL